MSDIQNFKHLLIERRRPKIGQKASSNKKKGTVVGLTVQSGPNLVKIENF